MESSSKYLTEIKTMLEMDDNFHDKKLNIIIKNTIQQLQNKIVSAVTSIPTELDYIVTEVAIKRFNRIGNEGVKSDSEDGKSTTYYNPDDDFKPFESDIKKFNSKNSNESDSRQGKVICY